MTIDKSRLTLTDSADFTEMSLLKRAIPIAEVFKGRLPSLKELDDINHELGTELATAVFQRTILQSEPHGPFAREVRAVDLGSIAGQIKSIASKFEVTVVASNLAQSGRKWGDHVEPWRAWAREMGFTTESIDTDPTKSVADNARVIGEVLAHSRHPHRILVTYGQGTSEFRYLLGRRLGAPAPGARRAASERVHLEAPELACVRAWINICGAFGGALSSDFLLRSWWRRWQAVTAMKWRGRNSVTLGETATRFPFWKQPTQVPSQTLVASLVGFPLLPQIPSSMRAAYVDLAKRGPNDGAVLATDAIAHPGLIVPVPGMSHRAEDSVLRPMFKRLLAVTAVTMAASLANERSRSGTGTGSGSSSRETHPSNESTPGLKY